jgi:hypothetical protein
MPLGYCDEVHRPISLDGARWNCTIGFWADGSPAASNCCTQSLLLARM